MGIKNDNCINFKMGNFNFDIDEKDYKILDENKIEITQYDDKAVLIYKEIREDNKKIEISYSKNNSDIEKYRGTIENCISSYSMAKVEIYFKASIEKNCE